jgi:hypothetical protein
MNFLCPVIREEFWADMRATVDYADADVLRPLMR